MIATPGILIGGTKSGCGKSTITAGIIRALMNKGLTVAPFKVGPDYLDPMLHQEIAGRKSWNLDSWLLSDNELFDTWLRGTTKADLAIVEGVMGLFDGTSCVSFNGSSADIANKLGLPVILVADASGVSYSIAATLIGFTKLMPKLKISGVILNNVTSERHYNILEKSLLTHTNIKPLGWSKHLTTWQLPERHLGIFNPKELPDLSNSLKNLAQEIALTIDLDTLVKLAQVSPLTKTLAIQAKNKHIPVAIANDRAFSFIYSDTLERLERLGVKWIPFSPISDDLPRKIAGIYLPGGYPELYAKEISNNSTFLNSLRTAHSSGMPILAECGGYMSLCTSVTDSSNRTYPMANLIPGHAKMTNRLQSFGYKELIAVQNTLICNAGDNGKAHEFHYSIVVNNEHKPAWSSKGTNGLTNLEGYASGNLLASYSHIHFGATPEWANNWVCRMYAWFSSTSR